MIDSMDSVKFSKDEKPQIIYRNSSEAISFVMTRKGANGEFFLYEMQGDKLVKLGKSPSPEKLEEKFNIAERLCE